MKAKLNQSSYDLPSKLKESKYRGHGSGTVTIEDGKVIDFDYTDVDNFTISTEANNIIRVDAGELISEDGNTLVITANFCSGKAHLF